MEREFWGLCVFVRVCERETTEGEGEGERERDREGEREKVNNALFDSVLMH